MVKNCLCQEDINQDDDDFEFEYTEIVTQSPNRRNTMYVAAITGTHPVYGVNLKFVCPIFSNSPSGTKYTFYLENNIYQVAFNSYSKDTGRLIERNRFWLVVFQGDVYDYAYGDISQDYALLTAYNIQAQLYGAEIASRIFISKTESN